MAEEIADVVLFCATMAMLCQINLSEAILAKIKKVTQRFPAPLFQQNGKSFTEVYEALKVELGE